MSPQRFPDRAQGLEITNLAAYRFLLNEKIWDLCVFQLKQNEKIWDLSGPRFFWFVFAKRKNLGPARAQREGRGQYERYVIAEGGEVIYFQVRPNLADCKQVGGARLTILIARSKHRPPRLGGPTVSNLDAAAPGSHKR